MPKNITANPRILLCGVLGSSGLLVLFLILQWAASPALKLPVQWLWVSLAPVVVSLLAGGYIIKVKAGSSGIEVEGLSSDLSGLPEAKRETEGTTTCTPEPSATWQQQRQKEYERSGGLFLVHVYKPSDQTNQLFNVYLYLVRHVRGSIHPVKTGFPEVKQVEFYFGDGWGCFASAGH